MVVLNQQNSDNPMMYDLSFIYSHKCNLQCSFCMYNGGPDAKDTIDYVMLADWIDTVDMERIASFGIYGGEPSLFLTENTAIMGLVEHLDKPHFVITNGTWSKSYPDMVNFLSFCQRFKMHIVVSGTPEHREHQDREILEWLKRQYPDAFRLKPEEENYHAMGRLEGKMPINCKRKCMSWNRALRIGVQPDGTIIYQNCEGVYPVVGNISESFEEVDERIRNLRLCGFGEVCKFYKGQI